MKQTFKVTNVILLFLLLGCTCMAEGLTPDTPIGFYFRSPARQILAPPNRDAFEYKLYWVKRKSTDNSLFFAPLSFANRYALYVGEENFVRVTFLSWSETADFNYIIKQLSEHKIPVVLQLDEGTRFETQKRRLDYRIYSVVLDAYANVRYSDLSVRINDKPIPISSLHSILKQGNICSLLTR